MAIEYIPVVVAIKDRPELTRQTVETALKHTKVPIQLILVDDGSQSEVTQYLLSLKQLETMHQVHIKVVIMPEPKYVGATKNAGAAVAYPSKYIYFSDNDVYFCEGWLERMLAVMEANPSIGILGGDKHPHHGVISRDDEQGIVYSDQQVGYSMLMQFDTFRMAGPFTHAPFDRFGMEDTDMCSHVTGMGLSIASVDPRVVIHCGMTTHINTQCAGYPDYMAQQVPQDCIRL